MAHDEEQVQHFPHSHCSSESDGLLYPSHGGASHRIGFKVGTNRSTTRKSAGDVFHSVATAILSIVMCIFASCCMQFALRSIHVTIIVQSQWLNCHTVSPLPYLAQSQ